jgi:thiol-disulfide isomerase/thioredoxin
VLTVWELIILVLATGFGTAAAAQGCDDCREIKKEYRDGALARYTPAAAPPSSAPSVRAVLYWSEECGHCEDLREGVLPQFQKKYSAQLEVRLVEVVSLEDISAFYDVAQGYGFARGKAAVPFLLIGDHALMGTAQIEAELPGLVDAYLAAGGSDWPAQDGPRATPRWLPPADVGCALETPCPDTPTTAAHEDTSNRAGAGWPIVALGAVTGGGLAALLTWRTRRRRNPAASLHDNTPTSTSGDNDAT